MNRNLGISILILCFVLSSANVGLAAQVLDVPPVIVQPYDLSAINLKIFELDRETQEQELAIRGLIKENQRLSNAALSGKQNAVLEKINKDLENTQRVSKYSELIRLTQDVDDVKSVGQTLELKKDVIEEKYKILTDLKNEMAALNDKVKGETEEKINRYEEILAQKNRQIAQLNDDLARVQREVATKDEEIKSQKIQIDNFQKPSKESSLYPEKSLDLPPIIVESSDNRQQAAAQMNPLKNQSVLDADQQSQFMALSNTVKVQALDLKAKDDSIRWLNQVLAAAKNKAEFYKLTSQQDQLSMQQIQGEVQDIKDDFARHFKDYDHFETAIASFKNQVSQLGMQLSQKQAQVDLLKSELENKITGQKDQSGQVDQLKQQLGSKTAQWDQLTLMVDEYQKKLESKNNAFNEQLGQILSFKNYQAHVEKQIVDLNARLQEKEAEVIKIKKDMYDLQELSSAKDRDSQAKDLSLSVLQQEVTHLKAEMALGGPQDKGMPSSDELNFLRAGFKQASAQLGQKEDMLHQIKVNAGEYEKEFKEQSKEFQSLKDQLHDARLEIRLKNEELRLKDMEIIRVKELSHKSEKNLQDVVTALAKRLEAADIKLMRKTRQDKLEALQAQLKRANTQIRVLKEYINQLRSLSKDNPNPSAKKLSQALDKINEQGREIKALSDKLQDCGKSVDFTKESVSNNLGIQKLF